MGPLIISTFFGLLLLLQVTVLFRSFDIQKRAKAMLSIWILNLPILIAINIYTYKNDIFPFNEILGGLNANVLLCFFFYTAVFFGGILQIYNLADRGLSLRILIDILNKHDGKVTPSEMLNKYSEGKGMSWMYQKRINDMAANNLILIKMDEIRLSSKGMKLAWIFSKLRILYNL